MTPQKISTSSGPDAEAASGDVPLEVERLLRQALATNASDVHIEPLATGHELRLRVDGLLEPVGRVNVETGRGMVTRLMVLAQLLTYRQDVPQEGRLASAAGIEAGQGAAKVISLRVSIMPTTHGLRAVIRMPAELTQPRTLQTLGLRQRAAFSFRHIPGTARLSQADGCRGAWPHRTGSAA